MDQQINGHTEAYLKRQAKNIKKETGLPYRKALEQAAITAGFQNYKHFLNQLNRPVNRTRVRLKVPEGAPVPPVIRFRTFGARKAVERPNAQMKLATHITLGKLLKEVRDAAEAYKRLKNPIGDVRNRLDDWVACEYPDHNELPNDIFVNIYYGNEQYPAEYSPLPERRAELVTLCREAMSILKENYHDCRPLRELLQKLETAIKWINLWPQGRKPKGVGSQGQIGPGALVLLKRNRKPAIVIRHDRQKGTVHCYSNGGPMSADREEVTLPKDQSAAALFKPMRLWLPYIRFRYPDGTELLVNRDYRPLWARKSGRLIPVDPDAIAHPNAESLAFFKDGSTPWGGNKATLAICLSVLEEWGVADHVPGPLALLPQAIAKGDVTLLRREQPDKLFPAYLAP